MPDQFGRPTNEHELNRQLADTIGASVEQLLGIGRSEADNMQIDLALQQMRSGAGPGQPGAGGSTQEQAGGGGQPAQPVSAPAANAQPAAPAMALEGDIDWDSVKDANGLYLGKYKTRQEAVKGVAHTVAMAKAALSQRDTLLAENQRLRQQDEALRRQPMPVPGMVQQGNPAPSPSRGEASSPTPNIDTVLSRFQENNGNLDAEDLKALVGAISEHAVSEARRVANEEVERRNQLVQQTNERWDKVNTFMAEKHPDSLKFESELALFVQTHPLIGAGVQALIAQDRHEEATEQAWLAFVQEQGIARPFVPAPATRENVEKEIRLDAADQVRREAVADARRDAGVIGAGAGGRGVHENANLGPSDDEFNQSVIAARNGDGARWRQLVFGPSLNHPIFGS